ncbi:CrcB protein [Marinococcus luteus]|uniref:Fluoride-specific ion channel FluC n=1 Tax=Marinococcus luteus TaxID=1122204 RepID=A0A1H2UI03_9BACI|nr:CrcB family protein [Marinococcus luteus]SDW55751.1 CrcB protein [Marinococcus luteus]
MTWLLVAIGGAFGATARAALVSWSKENGWHRVLPFGTMFVNVSGSFLLGLIVARGAGITETVGVGIGFLGAFTTFSTFNMEIIQKIEAGEGRNALLYGIWSYTLGILAAAAGYFLG